MGFIKNKLFIFIILILLQSCSGGRIGNFFESSFKNIEETKIKEDVKNNLKNKIVINSGGIVEKNKNIEEKKIKEDIKNNLKNKVLKKSEKKSKNNKITSDKNIIKKVKLSTAIMAMTTRVSKGLMISKKVEIPKIIKNSVNSML